SALLIDFGLDKGLELEKAFLPAEIAGVGRDHIRHTLLLNVDLRAGRYGFQGHRDLHLAWQIWVIEAVSVDETFARNELEIAAAEGMAMAGGEIPKRHSVLAAN